MWIIERRVDGKKIYLLNKEYTVGRKDCTIQIAEDTTVSRKHLVLKPEYSDLDVTSLKIKDLGSTYGTYLNPTSSNNGRIQTNEWTEMPNHSTFHFGIQNEWLLKWEDITVLCSAVAPTGRGKLSLALSKIGAKQVSDWDSSITHLVMEKVVFTQKVMRGLIFAKPIVTVEYFESWVNALDCNPASPVPDLHQFIPPLDSSLAQVDKGLFLPNIARRSVFAGKTFVFPTTDQFENMSIPVEMAGGKALPICDSFKDAILIEDPSTNSSNDYNTALNLLKAEGKRPVPMKEIGWAILTCSTQRYCNDLLNLEHTLFGKLSDGNTNATHLGAVLAPETQEIGAAFSRPREEQQVLGQPPAKKIKVEPSDELPFKQPPAKKMCLDHPTKNESVREKTKKSIKSASSVVDTVSIQNPSGLQAEETSTVNIHRNNITQSSSTKNTTLSWHSPTDHSRVLDETSVRMMVKLKLVRSSLSQDDTSISREGKQQSLQETSHVSTRIRSMRIASYRDGRWIKSDSVINQ